MEKNPMPPDQDPPAMAVIVVAYQSAEVIGDCLASLIRQSCDNLRIIVVDNASTDSTVTVARNVVEREGRHLTESPVPDPTRLPGVLLVRSDVNAGFAGGVNIGLRVALQDPAIRLFWLLNPDCTAQQDAAENYQNTAIRHSRFALMGGRTLFQGETAPIQSDGGRLSRWTAVCQNLNNGTSVRCAVMPASEELDFFSGANLVASRLFVQQAGLMSEDYFLYYEEVDWALRRGRLPLITCPEAIVHHHGGTAAGSGGLDRIPSDFSNYFNYRNRLRFAWRHRPSALPGAYLYSCAKIIQLLLHGARNEAFGALLGLHQLGPTQAIRKQLSADAAQFAFGQVCR